MKLQIDTAAKTIKLESNVQLKTLVETLDRLLPKGEWKEFTLETNTTITYWSSPTIIEKHYPYQPWQYPWYSNGTTYIANKAIGSSDYTLCASGKFNVELSNDLK